MPTALAFNFPSLFGRLKRTSSSYIHKLPFDIHVDQIFIHLVVEDILALRQVDKTFFLLTHEPIIWRRFLETMNIPIPPLRPTFRYSLQATDFEIEQLVTRAITVDDNWRRKEFPRIYHREVIETKREVVDLALVPGGKYLFASLKDSSNLRFWVVVYAMDHPQGPTPIACFTPPDKAYNLEAKYAKYKGVEGIMLSHVSRKFAYGMDAGINVAELSHRFDIDPSAPLCHRVFNKHIPLNCLESLADPTITPGSEEYIRRCKYFDEPFEQLAELDTTANAEHLQIFEHQDAPYLAIEQPFVNQIAVVNLAARSMKTLFCEPLPLLPYPQQAYRIRTFKVLPEQNQILVIRSITDHRLIYTVEMFDMPKGDGITYGQAKSHTLIHGRRFGSINIAERHIPKKREDHPTLRYTFEPPPPISLFFQSVGESGLSEYAIFPVVFDTPSGRQFRYSATDALQMTMHVTEPLTPHILPGAHRALMYTVPQENLTQSPQIVNLRRYTRPACEDGTAFEMIVTKEGRYKTPLIPYVSAKPEIPYQINQKGGICSAAWDETIGRLCIASDLEDGIQVLDFSHALHPDDRFATWKKARASMNI
ncbi:hypothetical protein BDQ12DRAFT_645354 [Crucibulum laeve]|uniref:F-box domain-containing protein n=1 Tax=Crucibulum laeve TaxID=68775 RepID=A0A5C3MLF7_9AGAR|nr:hypothetical protein BDQ12DRAFT_645354 [Crucibulum laeve]